MRWIAVLALVGLAQSAVIGIDFGSEFIKLALVRPGTPFHIVVDEQSKRKMSSIVAFDKGNERLFCNHASSLVVRNAERGFQYVQRLLGKTLNSPEVKQLQEMHYPWDLRELPNRNGAVGVALGDAVYSPEELIAMQLAYLQKIAKDDAGVPVTGAVITVPGHWAQAERQAMLDAANLAGMNVLSLVNEDTAAAIQYGIDLKYNVTDAPRYIVLYNMGSMVTTATAVEFTAFDTLHKRQNKTVGQVRIVARASDPLLGGTVFDDVIVKFLVEKVNAQFKKFDPAFQATSRVRVMAKLRSAANKAKLVLSANKIAPIHVASLHEDRDFKTEITRAEFEKLSAPLLGRVGPVLQSVLDQSNLSTADLLATVLIGGSTRIPAVQDQLKLVIKRDDFGLNLNGDEAMAMGAVFRAANLSTAFQVRKLGLVDVANYPIGVRVANVPLEAAVAEEQAGAEDSADERKFTKRASLFSRYNKLGKRRTVAFSHTRDLSISLQYDDARQHLPPEVSAALQSINVTGLEALLAAPGNEALLSFLGEPQKPKVSLSFLLDWSGLVELTAAEATLDEMVKVPVSRRVNKTDANLTAVPAADNAPKTEGEAGGEAGDRAGDGDDQGTAAANGETETEGDEGAAGEEKTEAEGGEEKVADDKKTETEGEGKAEGAGTEGEGQQGSTEGDKERADAEGAKGAGKGKKTAKKSKDDDFVTITEYVDKKKTHHFPLKISSRAAPESLAPLTKEQIAAAKTVLANLQKADDVRFEIAGLKNDLEAYIYSAKRDVGNEENSAVSTEEQRAKVEEACQAAEEWLLEHVDDGEAEKFRQKKRELEVLAEPVFLRAFEAKTRPQVLNQTNEMLAFTLSELTSWNESRPWIPQDDRLKLADMAKNLTEWLAGRVAEQEKLQPFERPAFFSKQVHDRGLEVAKLYQRLAKIPKPVEKKTEKKADKEKKKKPKAEEKQETDTDTPEDKTEEEKRESPEDTEKDEL